jgi:hypothetical protein
MPLRPRHGYAAALHRGLPTDDINRPRSSPLRDEGAGTRRYASPHRPGWSWRSALERRSAAGSSRTPSRLASRTRAVRSCRRVPSLSGLLAALPGVSQVGLPQPRPAAATAGRRRSCTSSRLLAPRSARCPTTTPRSAWSLAAPAWPRAGASPDADAHPPRPRPAGCATSWRSTPGRCPGPAAWRTPRRRLIDTVGVVQHPQQLLALDLAEGPRLR